MKILIFTPIPVEYQAVRRHLSHLKAQILDGNLYETGCFVGRHDVFDVTLRETGPKNSIVALAVEQAVRHFNPAVALLVGIAGGVKDVQVGDVVVGTKAYGYEAGKESTGGFAARPDVMPYSRELLAIGQLVSRRRAWKQRIRHGAPAARVFFGPIASGEKVVATSHARIYEYLKTHYNDTLALEMEAIGFAQAACNRSGLHALNIRGISDLLDHKTSSDTSGAREVAAERAAAFAFEIIHEMDPALFLQFGNPDLKDLLKGIFEALAPAERSKNFAYSANTDLQTFWKKIKSLFIVIEALARTQRT